MKPAPTTTPRTALTGAAALGLAALLALPAFAQPPGVGGPGEAGPGAGPAAFGVRGPGGFALRAVADFLDLTEQQRDQARTLLEDLAAEVRPLAAEARTVRGELQTALAGDDPDPADVGALILELHTLGDAMKAAREDFDGGFTALLTPDQAERWEFLKEARRIFGRHGRHEARRGRGAGPWGGPPGGGS